MGQNLPFNQLPLPEKNRTIRRKTGLTLFWISILIAAFIFTSATEHEATYIKQSEKIYLLLIVQYIIPSIVGALLFISTYPKSEAQRRTNLWYKILGYIFIFISIVTSFYSFFVLRFYLPTDTVANIKLIILCLLGVPGAIFCFHPLLDIDICTGEKIELENPIEQDDNSPYNLISKGLIRHFEKDKKKT